MFKINQDKLIESQKIAKRAERNKLLNKADIEINKLIDTGGDYSALSAYRQSLRDFTEQPEWYLKELPTMPKEV